MIRVAVIGCGKIAQVRHLPEYATNPNAQLVAYYDKNSQRAHEVAAQYGGKVYDSYFATLADDIAYSRVNEGSYEGFMGAQVQAQQKASAGAAKK